MGRAIAVIVIGVVKPVTCTKEQRRDDEDTRENQQNRFDIHGINDFLFKEPAYRSLFLLQSCDRSSDRLGS